MLIKTQFGNHFQNLSPSMCSKHIGRELLICLVQKDTITTLITVVNHKVCCLLLLVFVVFNIQNQDQIKNGHSEYYHTIIL